jgi:hypothetical protein
MDKKIFFLLFVLFMILNVIYFLIFLCYIFQEMNTKSELILRFDSRYKVVGVLKKIIILDFAQMNSSVVPFLLLLKIVFEFQSVLGFFLLLFYYWMYVDEIINWEIEINTEISKYSCNVKNGITGMNRDLNMIMTQFHKSYQDTREVFLFFFFKEMKNKNILFLDILH